MRSAHITVFGTSLVLGILMIIQFRSYTTAEALLNRETTSTNLFAEIQMLKRTSEELQTEKDSLEKQLQESSDAAKTKEKITEEVSKYELLAGVTEVQGPGIKISFQDGFTVPLFWLVDLVNDLWSAGAEAIAVNNIRITNTTWGLTEISGHLLLNGTTIQEPLVITAIGNTEAIAGTLSQATGFIERFTTQYDKNIVSIEAMEQVTMPAIQ